MNSDNELPLEQLHSASPSSPIALLTSDNEKKPENNTENNIAKDVPAFKPDWHFWLIYISLCLVTFAGAVDNTIVFTALPTITRAVGGGDSYVWIANSYIVASTAIQPLFGQISNVLGRRIPSLLVVALFILGSGIAGGAKSVTMLIAGRTIQGVGCGGIFVLLDIIVCDLVPLRERGKYLGPLLGAGGLGSTLGPLIGGALTKASWRWVFYITIPFSALAFITMLLFLKMNHVRDPSWKKNLIQIDLPGNALLISSITAVLLGLLMGGTTFPWSSWRIILPLVLGFLGWFAFHIYQMSPWCKIPTIPPRLFSNPTSAVGFILSFLSGVLLEWIVYFYPLYFQALRGTTPLGSGVDTLPFNILLMPVGMVSGILMTKTGVYRPFHALAYIFLAIGLGLSSMLDATSSTAQWVIFQMILAFGLGLTFVTLLPAIQAALPEGDVATATATYSFFRSFGFIWGVTIPSLILNSLFTKSLHTIDDANVQAQLANGGAYQFAAYGAIQKLPTEIRQQVVKLYVDTFRISWLSALPFAIIGFLLVFVEKHVDLRQELETDFGMETERKNKEGGKLEAGINTA